MSWGGLTDGSRLVRRRGHGLADRRVVYRGHVIGAGLAAEDADVGYFSMHRSPFYPGTGSASEVGAGKGHGATMNLPISFGTPRETQLALFRKTVLSFARRIRPQLVLVSAGFDSHKNDPIGSLGLESEDFLTLTQVLLEVADEFADRRLVSVLEGGYNPDAMAECGSIHLQALLDAS